MNVGAAPPGANLHDTRCEHMGGAGGGQCRNRASWPLPEYPYCGHHANEMPLPLIDAKRRRVARWQAEGAALWERIMREEQP